MKYIADKIYGTLGLVDESVHDHIQASSTKFVSETYTDAMTYMINIETEKYDVNVLELYLTFPCSLSVSSPIERLPSWVPEFSRNVAILDLSTRYVWFWLYQTTRYDGRKPRAEFQNVRHQITMQWIDRSMFKVYDNILFVKQFVVDQIAEVVPSALCQDFVGDSDSKLNDFFEHMEEIRRVGQQLKPLLDQLRNVEASEMTFGN